MPRDLTTPLLFSFFPLVAVFLSFLPRLVSSSSSLGYLLSTSDVTRRSFPGRCDPEPRGGSRRLDDFERTTGIHDIPAQPLMDLRPVTQQQISACAYPIILPLFYAWRTISTFVRRIVPHGGGNLRNWNLYNYIVIMRLLPPISMRIKLS